MVLDPRHRGDCADFFSTPGQTARMELDAPDSAIGDIEHAAAQTGRTWNDQLTYVLGLCLGYHLPDFEDGRSVEDWRTLLSRCRFRWSESEAWSSFTCLGRKTP
jgi:hypothetical protein